VLLAIGAVAGRLFFFADSFASRLKVENVAEFVSQKPLVKSDRLEKPFSFPSFDSFNTATPSLGYGSPREKLLRQITEMLGLSHDPTSTESLPRLAKELNLD